MERGCVQKFLQLRRVTDFEDTGNPGLLVAGTDHIRRGARAKQQRERIDNDGLAATGLSGQQVESAVEAHAQLVDDRIVLYVEFKQHLSYLKRSEERYGDNSPRGADVKPAQRRSRQRFQLSHYMC